MYFELRQPVGKIVFEQSDGGMPTSLRLSDGTSPIAPGKSKLSLMLSSGQIYTPAVGDCSPLVFSRVDEKVLEFTNLEFRNENGTVLPDFHLSLRHQFFADGAFFTTAMLHGENSAPPGIAELKLELALDLKEWARVRCALHPRTGMFSSADIQTFIKKQIFENGQPFFCKGNLAANCGFYATRPGASSIYCEFFLEGGNTLSGNPCDADTALHWNGTSPTLVWRFQNKPCTTQNRPWQWCNRWGWQIAPPPQKRRIPPQQICQYIDNYRHYPRPSELKAIADSGCSVLIIHSNWRRDAKNDGVPYNEKRLRDIIEYAHSRGIRIALYIRGNEKEVKESAAEWFDNYLTKDFDGLYMDYGSPFCWAEISDENFPGGHIPFYRHYRNLRRLRERVGEKGIFISHTGSAFSALGMSLMDGYISGEAEGGILLANRYENEYFTMAAAATGTLWSAAFPSYSTAKIVPYLAATGQAPHSPLGMQFSSSSLHHPPVPGINDKAFQPLWRLWHCFDTEEEITVFNDYNSNGVFANTPGQGHYLMISRSGKRAMLLVSNFGKGDQPVTVNWSQIAFSTENKYCWRLCPDMTTPGKAERCCGELRPVFNGYPVMAFLWDENERDFSEYSKPYPEVGSDALNYLSLIAEQKRLRDNALSGKNVEIKILIDNSLCTALEDSNFFDLHDSTLELGELLPDGGAFRKVGIIAKNGLVMVGGDCYEEDKQLPPGGCTPAISLNKVFEAGEHVFAIRSMHFGTPFYSLISVLVRSDDAEWERLDFHNHVEPDRALLHWKCTIGKKPCSLKRADRNLL